MGVPAPHMVSTIGGWPHCFPLVVGVLTLLCLLLIPSHRKERRMPHSCPQGKAMQALHRFSTDSFGGEGTWSATSRDESPGSYFTFSDITTPVWMWGRPIRPSWGFRFTLHTHPLLVRVCGGRSFSVVFDWSTVIVFKFPVFLGYPFLHLSARETCFYGAFPFFFFFCLYLLSCLDC